MPCNWLLLKGVFQEAKHKHTQQLRWSTSPWGARGRWWTLRDMKNYFLMSSFVTKAVRISVTRPFRSIWAISILTHSRQHPCCQLRSRWPTVWRWDTIPERTRAADHVEPNLSQQKQKGTKCIKHIPKLRFYVCTMLWPGHNGDASLLC